MVGRHFVFGANHYRARAGLELGADSTWTGPLVDYTGADPFRACSGLNMVGRQFIFGANHYQAHTEQFFCLTNLKWSIVTFKIKFSHTKTLKLAMY